MKRLKQLVLPIIAILTLVVLKDKLVNLETKYVVIICLFFVGIALQPYLAKMKQDKKENKLNYSKLTLFAVSILVTIAYGTYDYFFNI